MGVIGRRVTLSVALVVGVIIAGVLGLGRERPGNSKPPPATKVPASAVIGPSADSAGSDSAAASAKAAEADRRNGAQAEHAGEFQPGALYSRYIDRALAGDRDAQYVVMRALRECLRLPESRGEIEELARRDLPPGAMDAITERFRRCEDLRSKVEDPESEYDHWFGRVVGSDHALVAMKGNQPEAEKRELIRTAIAQDYPEPFMYAEAYGEAATFHRTYPAYLSDPRHQAWGLLYCAHEPHCDEPSERALLRERYHDHQYDEIMETLADIQAAIDRQDWRAIGF